MVVRFYVVGVLMTVCGSCVVVSMAVCCCFNGCLLFFAVVVVGCLLADSN